MEKYQVSSLVPPEERIPFVGEEEIEFVLKVPQEAVKFLLGRQGAKVNQASGRRGWWAGDPPYLPGALWQENHSSRTSPRAFSSHPSCGRTPTPASTSIWRIPARSG